MALRLETPPGVSLRRSRKGDHDFARGLYLESTEPLLRALDRFDADRVEARFARSFQENLAQVIRADGADIGWLQVSATPDRLHVHQMHLVATYRNRGIGSRLIRSIQDHGYARGVPVTLNVIRGNPAIALYRRLGFRVASEDEELFRMRWDPPGAAR